MTEERHKRWCTKSTTRPIQLHISVQKYKIQDCSCIGAADMNGASLQPASRQNRCSEVADDAGIARKRRATALTTAQYVGVGVAWVVST